MMIIVGIDPGPKQSAIVVLNTNGKKVDASWYSDNHCCYEILKRYCGMGYDFAIEMIACYGMAVGAEVFDTCAWIGRFERHIEINDGSLLTRISRLECKMALCHDSRAKDKNIRQALIDFYGPVGTKKSPGPLYGISGDMFAALAVATTRSINSRSFRL